jgi:hypothetical protein
MQEAQQKHLSAQAEGGFRGGIPKVIANGLPFYPPEGGEFSRVKYLIPTVVGRDFLLTKASLHVNLKFNRDF